jgi:hypothetical protein
VTPHRIDILTEITGVADEEAEAQTITIQLEGMTILVIGFSHLLQNKSAVGRPQDKADVARLEEMRNK